MNRMVRIDGIEPSPMYSRRNHACVVAV